ncbi:alanine--tRNA ligase [Candidatus Pelagibacter sp. HIMB1321]|uniref:alanine--tRNA ligase n=1 Tax=Candidatus Pelagibacter sp. HIMB1321 TaxID=1388755 RepID=UPI000A080526|nr:alanine--tRNA ligase [Candidatus Pelagibacter sp. HIMB1321]SMF71580.1 alanyl-tRNA synthetase [Candidatus Pelagibacter sp. HIMB1321]
MADKSLNEIRSTFLKYFEKNDHKIVESSNLVPNNDPTLMFANSGMVQFKNVFTGLEKRDYVRATTSQKCVRAGGKHNDLENVGYTPRHHTFFEMLGNFSFGDYFKEQAIDYAWNLITKDFGIDKNRLYVTVFHEDDEAFNFWKKIAGFSDDRIIRISTSDNFWSMGETGPCGPCSEIFYDHGDHLKGGLPGTPEEDGDRFIEIWNLVFMQYEQVSKDERINLPKPSVDTGMGLERIAALLQGTYDNYETDHFKKIIQSTSDIVKQKPDQKNLSSFRVIADHLRASSFLIAEGVLPSNEGRGYVLRRIMRRGMRHSHMLGSKKPIFANLFNTLLEEMSASYPELTRAESLIKETLKMEEEKFLVLLDRGIKILNEEISKIDKVLPGDVAFKLYETYGFPIDLTEDILKSKSLKFDKDRFGELMRESIELARKNWKGSGDSAVEKIWFGIKEKIGPTEFLGYENDQAQGIVKCLLKNHKEVSVLNKDDEGMIVLNQTPFYAESGGQVGDKGVIVKDDFKFEVTDVQKKLGDLFVHYGKVVSGSIKLDQDVELKIDVNRRNDTRAYHSATHLLHESLRRVLGDHVTQKGSLVEPERLRFDFSHMKPISNEEIGKIENYVNEMVQKKSEVKTRIMTPKEAVENGALALFGEKYGDEVRVLSMGEEGEKYFSTELCGGTHVKNTGDIGKFKIISQSSIAAGVRRIEALRDKQLEEYLENKEKQLNLSSEKNDEIIKDLSDQITNLGGKPSLDESDQKVLIKNLTKQLETLSVNSILKDKSKNITNDQTVNNVNIRFQKISDLPPKELRKLVDHGKKDLGEGIIVVFASKDEKVGLAVGVTDKLTEKYDAVTFVKVGSEIIGGKGGGGRKDFAQAGGQDSTKIDDAFESIKKLI